MAAEAKLPANQADTAAWFCQVLAHEHDLRAFLYRTFHRPADVSDVVQETYARLLALAPERRRGVRSWRAFLFTTARNVATDCLRRGEFVSLDALPELDRSSVVEEGEACRPDQILNLAQERDLLERAIASLPHKCREVMVLRKIHGLSQKEIALQLGIAAHTVEKHISHGVRLCAARLHEANSSATPGSDLACRTPMHAHQSG